MITEILCLAHFARDYDNIVTTDASKAGFGVTIWWRQNDDTIRPVAVASRYLNDAENNYSIAELKLLAAIWRLQKFRFYLHGKKVFLYTDHQALETLIEPNWAYLKHSARLTRWLDRVPYFDISTKHTTGKNLALTDNLTRHPTEEATTEETHEEEYVITILSEHFKLNHKNGQLLNMDRKFLLTDHSTNMTLETNPEWTNENVSPNKCIPDANSKNLTREQAQANK